MSYEQFLHKQIRMLGWMVIGGMMALANQAPKDFDSTPPPILVMSFLACLAGTAMLLRGLVGFQFLKGKEEKQWPL